VKEDRTSDIEALLRSRTAAVRASALTSIARAGAPQFANAALFDRNPVVREVAQLIVRRDGSDPAERYRSSVGSVGWPAPAVLAGLGETGDASDLDVVRRSIAHPEPRGRVEALRAIRRLGGVDVSEFVAALSDESPAVVRQASMALRGVAGTVPLEQLNLLLGEDSPTHVRVGSYRILRARDVWTRIRTDLMLYDDESGRLSGPARGDLDGWLSREAPTTYSMPSAETKHELESLVSATSGSLGRDREKLLRFHLGLKAS